MLLISFETPLALIALLEGRRVLGRHVSELHLEGVPAAVPADDVALLRAGDELPVCVPGGGAVAPPRGQAWKMLPESWVMSLGFCVNLGKIASISLL